MGGIFCFLVELETLDTVQLLNRSFPSSHSAAPYMIGKAARELSLCADEKICSVIIQFDPQGSFAQVYENQGSDEGFAAGVSGLEIISEEYSQALKSFANKGNIEFSIEIKELLHNEHPNRVDLTFEILEVTGSKRFDHYEAVSTGGGMFIISYINKQAIEINGKCTSVLIEHNEADSNSLFQKLHYENQSVINSYITDNLIQIDLESALLDSKILELLTLKGVSRVRHTCARQYAAVSGRVLFTTVDQVLQDVSNEENLAELAVTYESERLQKTRPQVSQYFDSRLSVMLNSIERGLLKKKEDVNMRFLQPSAQSFNNSKLPKSMQNTFMKDAISGALAVMEESTGRGVVCAAPTAGSAGIVPGCLYALAKEGATQKHLVDVLQVMSLIGAVFAARGSFAAETGGCSVETGASSAMGAAGITYYYGGSEDQVFGAAALCLMNTLGLICDPVGGEVEIPCHARNIAGVSHAWSASMAILGGFKSLLPFDELVDMTVEIGNKMRTDFKCTAKGGCAKTPTAQKLVSNIIHST